MGKSRVSWLECEESRCQRVGALEHHGFVDSVEITHHMSLTVQRMLKVSERQDFASTRICRIGTCSDSMYSLLVFTAIERSCVRHDDWRSLRDVK